MQALHESACVFVICHFAATVTATRKVLVCELFACKSGSKAVNFRKKLSVRVRARIIMVKGFLNLGVRWLYVGRKLVKNI